MKISVGLYGTSAHQIALALIQGFNKHYTLFRATSKLRAGQLDGRA